MSLRKLDVVPLEAVPTLPERETWIRKSSGYYRDIAVLTRFFVNEGQSVLEVGSSTGWLLRQITQASRRVGVDKSAAAVQEARSVLSSLEYPQAIDYRVQDFEDPDCEVGEKFDLIIFSDLLSYAYDAQTLLENARRHLNPGGRVLVTAYNSYLCPIYRIAEFFGLKRQPRPENWLTKGDIENLGDLAGFEEIRSGHRA